MRETRRDYREVFRSLQDVQGPQIIVACSGPQSLDCQPLAIVHVPFAWIVPEYSIDDDGLLPLIEPAIGTEPRPSLCR